MDFVLVSRVETAEIAFSPLYSAMSEREEELSPAFIYMLSSLSVPSERRAALSEETVRFVPWISIEYEE